MGNRNPTVANDVSRDVSRLASWMIDHPYQAQATNQRQESTNQQQSSDQRGNFDFLEPDVDRSLTQVESGLKIKLYYFSIHKNLKYVHF